MKPSRTPPSEPGDYVFTRDGSHKARRIVVYKPNPDALPWCLDSANQYDCRLDSMPTGWWTREPDPQGYVPPPLPKVEIGEASICGSPCRVLLVEGCVSFYEADGWRRIGSVDPIESITNRRAYQEPQA